MLSKPLATQSPASVAPPHAHRINGGQLQLLDGRHNPYAKPQLGHCVLLDLLPNDSLRYVPYAAPCGVATSSHFAEDYTGWDLDQSTWIFIGQVSIELHPRQMAKLLMATVGVSPLVTLRSNTKNCMFANLRSKSDMNQVFNCLKKRMLLDYDGAWFATDSEGETILMSEATSVKLSNLPSLPVTLEICLNPPHDWRGRTGGKHISAISLPKLQVTVPSGFFAGTHQRTVRHFAPARATTFGQ